MRKTTRILSLMVLSLLGLQSLQGQIDPLANIQFGTADSKKTEIHLESEGLIANPDIHKRYKFHIISGTENYPVRIKINPDGYGGKLRQIELNLVNSAINDPIKENDLSEIIGIYTDWYGEPSCKNNDSADTYNRDWIWRLNDFDIRIHAYAGDSYTTPKEFYSSWITYSMKNYDRELEKIQRSIVASLSPSEIVNVGINNLRWEQSANSNTVDLKIDIYDYYQKAKVDGRFLRAFRFNIIFENVFREELGKITDAEFEISSSLLSMPVTFTFNYNPDSTEGAIYEKIRNYAASNSVKVKAEVTKIAYSNGEIIN